MQTDKAKTLNKVITVIASLIILGLSVAPDNFKVSQTSWSSYGKAQFSSYDLAEKISNVKILGICGQSQQKPLKILIKSDLSKNNILRIQIKSENSSSSLANYTFCNIPIKYSNTGVEVSESFESLNIKPGNRLVESLTTLEIVSDLNFEYIIETSRYSPNPFRHAAFVVSALVFIVGFFRNRTKNTPKIEFFRKRSLLILFSTGTTLWGLFGPSIYDEGWTLITGQAFQNLGWFSNVYSSASAPMPLGTPFNYLTSFLLLLPKPLVFIRLTWAALVIISYCQMVRIMENRYGTLKPSIRLLAASTYFVLVVSLCGGWRPEILVLLIFNYMFLSIQSNVSLSPYFVGSLIALGLSISQSGVINFAFLVLLYLVRVKAPKKLTQAFFGFSLAFSWIILSHSNLNQFLKGILAFRSVETHSNIPLIGEVKRYTQFFLSPQSIAITITFCLISLSVLNILGNLKKSRFWDETSLLLLFSVLLLSVTPSKWWWHFAPISSLFVLHSLPYFFTGSKKTSRVHRTKIEYIVLAFIVIILVRSIYYNVRLSPTFPFVNSSTIPQGLFLIYLSISFATYFQYKKKKYASRHTQSELRIRIIVGFMTLSVLLPVIQNYLDTSKSQLSNVFERRFDRTCESLGEFYSLELSGQEILNAIETNKKVVSSISPQSYQLELKLPKWPNNQTELILPIRVPSGSFIQIVDEKGNYLVVESPKSHFSVEKEVPGIENALYEYSVSNQIPTSAKYIKATDRVQILRLREFDPSSKSFNLGLLTAGNFSVGNLSYSHLISLDQEIGSSALGVIPPLVSNFGCMSSNLFESNRRDNRMFLIQDDSMWFRDEQYETSKIIGHSRQQIEVPIWDADNVHTFNLAVFGF
jgi:hypothetical protein